MIVNPAKTLQEYFPTFKGGPSNHPEQKILRFAQTQGEPIALCYLDGVDPETHTFSQSELCNHAFYKNAIELLRLPTAGHIDAKLKHCIAYAPKTNMREFFKGMRLDMVNFRLAMELVLLYKLTGQDLYAMSHFACSFTPEDDADKSNFPDIEKLKTLYSKKDVSKQIQAIFDQKRNVSLPPRVLKGMEYLSFAESIHVFRALGVDPYQALVAFAYKDRAWMSTCREKSPLPTAFDVKPVQLLIPLDADSEQEEAEEARQNEGEIKPIETAPIEQASVASPASAAPIKSKDTCNQKGEGFKGGERKLTNNIETPASLSFGRFIRKVVTPLEKARSTVYLPQNIYVLRDSYLGHRSLHDRPFDEMFMQTAPSELDVFNYLSEISHVYHVPMAALFYTHIKYREFVPTESVTITPYTVSNLSTMLDYHFTDADNIFSGLAELVTKKGTVEFLNQFGYQYVRPASVDKLTTSAADSAHGKQPNPTDDIKAKREKEIPLMGNLELKLRVCTPCAADSWENDNPDHSKPGFHWEAASEDVRLQVTEKLAEFTKAGSLNPLELKYQLSQLLSVPFKAQISVCGKGYKAVIDLF